MRRAVLAIIALGLVGLGAVVDPTRAFACSCVGISTQRAFAEADAVFTGTVRSSGEAGGRSDRRVDIRFEVSQVYKGRVFASQVVASTPDPAACGLTPEIGSSWTIFATEQLIGTGDRAITRLRTGLCNGNLPSATAPSTLGRGEQPQPGESDRAERSVRADARATQALVVAGLAALAVAAVIGVCLIVIWRPRRPTV